MSAAPSTISEALLHAQRGDAWVDGLFPGIPEDVYHRRLLGVVSKSALEKLAKTPATYRAWIAGEVDDEETDALAFGRAFHCALLEPERFASTYVVAPLIGDKRRKDNKARWERWKAENEGKPQLDADDAQRIAGMVAAVRAHPLASKMIRDGESEVTAYWTDDETGLRCRARADYLVRSRRMVVDAKSCQDASPEGFRKAVFNHRYHWQHAHYRSGFAALGENVEHFVFLAVEKEPPYLVAVYTLDAAAVSIAHGKVRHHMSVMARCLKENTWPGYPSGIQTIDTPPWET